MSPSGFRHECAGEPNAGRLKESSRPVTRGLRAPVRQVTQERSNSQNRTFNSLGLLGSRMDLPCLADTSTADQRADEYPNRHGCTGDRRCDAAL